MSNIPIAFDAQPANGGVVITTVDVYVKALKSTDTVQYYYFDKRYTVPDNRLVRERRDITLAWPSSIPGFFDCQLVDGRKVTIFHQDLLIEAMGTEAQKQK